MALAAFKLIKCTGAGAATEEDCGSHPCFLSVDLVSENTAAYSIGIPGDAPSSPNYSMEVWLRLEMTAVPNNQVTALKVWIQGDPPQDGVTVLMGTTDTGATPTHSASSVATVDAYDNYYGPSNALAVGIDTGDDKMDAVGEQSDFIVLQLKVEDGVDAGDITTVLLSIDYTES